jgi:hypothetical protein
MGARMALSPYGIISHRELVQADAPSGMRGGLRRGSALHRWEVVRSMSVIFEFPTNVLLAACCWLVAVSAAWRGVRWFVNGLREANRPSGAVGVVRGIRGAIIAVSMVALGGGVLLMSRGLLVFGAIFLGEELYETGVVLLALRAGQQGWWERISQPA